MSERAKTVKELRKELKRKGLPTKGNKNELVNRINESDGILLERVDRVSDTVSQQNSSSDEEVDVTVINRENKISLNNAASSVSIRYTPREVSEILPEFEPENDRNLSVERWIKKVEKLKLFYKFEDDLLLFAVASKLKGEARSWYDSTEDMFETFNQFAEAIKRKFIPVVNEADAHIAMMSRKRRSNETLLEYVAEMCSLGKKGNLPERAIVKYFIMGMKDDELFNVFQSHKIETTDELRDKVKWSMSLRAIRTAGRSERGNERTNLTASSNVVANVATRPKTKNAVSCFNCFQEGHFARSCPIPPRRTRCKDCGRVHKKENQSIVRRQ